MRTSQAFPMSQCPHFWCYVVIRRRGCGLAAQLPLTPELRRPRARFSSSRVAFMVNVDRYSSHKALVAVKAGRYCWPCAGPMCGGISGSSGSSPDYSRVQRGRRQPLPRWRIRGCGIGQVRGRDIPPPFPQPHGGDGGTRESDASGRQPLSATGGRSSKSRWPIFRKCSR